MRLGKLWLLGLCGGLVACGSDASGKPQGAGAAAGADGSEGSGNSGNGKGGTTPGSSGTPGGFDSFWRQASFEATVLDIEAPTTLPVTKTLDVAPTFELADDGRDVEAFQQIKDDQLVSYAYIDGDDAYYRIATKLVASDDAYLLNDSKSTSIYTLEDGVLTLNSSQLYGTKLVATVLTFAKYEADFPPADWPTELVEAELPAGGAP